MSLTCYLLLAIWYSISDTCYLKLASSCKNLIPFAPVVRPALVLMAFSSFLKLILKEFIKTVKKASKTKKTVAVPIFFPKTKVSFPICEIYISVPVSAQPLCSTLMDSHIWVDQGRSTCILIFYPLNITYYFFQKRLISFDN